VCPTITATANAVRAAFIKDGDTFAEKGIQFLNPFFNLAQPALFERQIYDQLKELLGLTREENARAVQAGYARAGALQAGHPGAGRRRPRAAGGRRTGWHRPPRRPYHADPGINQGILVELQNAAIRSSRRKSLPIDGATLDRLFARTFARGCPISVSIADVWKNSFNSVSNQKLWAAKFRGPAPEPGGSRMSSFRCGHDAPIYSVIEAIVETSGTPYFSFKDLDENRAAGSIRIRVETIDYSSGDTGRGGCRSSRTRSRGLSPRSPRIEDALMATDAICLPRQPRTLRRAVTTTVRSSLFWSLAAIGAVGNYRQAVAFRARRPGRRRPGPRSRGAVGYPRVADNDHDDARGVQRDSHRERHAFPLALAVALNWPAVLPEASPCTTSGVAANARSVSRSAGRAVPLGATLCTHGSNLSGRSAHASLAGGNLSTM